MTPSRETNSLTTILPMSLPPRFHAPVQLRQSPPIRTAGDEFYSLPELSPRNSPEPRKSSVLGQGLAPAPVTPRRYHGSPIRHRKHRLQVRNPPEERRPHP